MNLRESTPRADRMTSVFGRRRGAERCPASLLSQQKGPDVAFTLLEMMVAMTVTVLIVVLLLGLLQATTTTWQRNTDRSKSFASARAAFESMSRTISESTLNTYQDYYDANRSNRPSGSMTFRPDVYGRKSDLHFVTGNALVTGQQGGASSSLSRLITTRTKPLLRPADS